MPRRRTKRFALCVSLTAFLCAIGIVGAAAVKSGAHPVSPLRHAARISTGAARSGDFGDLKVFESPNWSGYAVVGKEFTDARGTWTIPTINCAANPTGAASFWVGIDGWDNGTVEQTGTESQCDGVLPVTYAWYEFAPRAGVTITTMRVSPGEDMAADVHFDGTAFIVTLTDLTTGESYTAHGIVPQAKRTSAEWIAESNGYSGLPDFDAVRFGPNFTHDIAGNAATDATTSGSIGAFGNRVQVSVLGHDNLDEAVPSYLSLDGTSFTVTYWKP